MMERQSELSCVELTILARDIAFLKWTLEASEGLGLIHDRGAIGSPDSGRSVLRVQLTMPASQEREMRQLLDDLQSELTISHQDWVVSTIAGGR